MDEEYSDDVMLTMDDDTLFEKHVLTEDESLREVDNLLSAHFLKIKELDL